MLLHSVLSGDINNIKSYQSKASCTWFSKKSKQNTTRLFVLTSSFPRHCPPATLYFISNTFSLTNNAQWQPYKRCYFVIVAQLPLVCFFTRFLICYIYTKPHTILIYVCKASAGAELLKKEHLRGCSSVVRNFSVGHSHEQLQMTVQSIILR